jgi:uncharacterized protein (TIGR02001 family)
MGWKHESGVYAGIWGSNVNFANAYLETDFYGGFANSIGNFSYDTNVTFFYYPQEVNANYFEFALKTSYNFDFLVAKLGLIGSPDALDGYFGALGTAFYVPFGVAVPIPEDIKYFDVSIDGNAGYTSTEEDIFANDDDYWDWNTGLTFTVPVAPTNLAFDFRYVDTDVDDLHDGGARFVFGTTLSF